VFLRVVAVVAIVAVEGVVVEFVVVEREGFVGNPEEETESKLVVW
jgi:hypothetical protein